MQSVWHLSHSSHYYLTHPWRLFCDIGRMFRDAWRRSKYGYTYMDLWDFDLWFSEVAPGMLRHMVDYGSGYPGTGEFDTHEKWRDAIHQLADDIEMLNPEKFDETHNEYYKAYYYNLTGHALANEYHTRFKEVMEEYEEHKKKTFARLEELWNSLWD